MAINLLDMLKDQIGDAVISQAGKFLGAEESGVKSAMGAALPTILGSMITQGATPSGSKGLIDMITKGGYDGSVFDDLGSVFSGGDATSSFLNSGSGILKSLMGNKLGSVVDVIASVSGLKKGASSSLMSMAAPLVMSMVGRYVKNKALDAVGLSKFLGTQRSAVASALPAGVGSLLGFAKDAMGDRVEKTVEHTREAATATANEGGGMMKRLFPLLLLAGLGLAYFGWNYFAKTANTVVKGAKDMGSAVAEGAKDAGTAVVEGAKDAGSAVAEGAKDVGSAVAEGAKDAGTAVAEGAKGAVNAAGEMAGEALDATTAAARKALEGVKFAAGSVGEKFSNFLKSGAKGNSTFRFNNLTFPSGSAAIQDMTEVNNLAAVLKAYPNINIEVGGHTDSSGKADMNNALSLARANAVKAQLVAQGIAGDRISTKGYGSSMPATANAADAANRRVEIKVVTKK